MLKSIISALLVVSCVRAMNIDDPMDECLLVGSAKNNKIIALLAPDVANRCAILREFKRGNFGPPVVLIPDEYAKPEIWEKLTRCLANEENIKKIESQKDLEEVLIWANYLQNNLLYSACLSEWANREYETPVSQLPRELKGALSNEILRKYILHNKMISLALEEISPKIKLLECKGAESIWSCAMKKDGNAVAVGRDNGNIHYWVKQAKGWKREMISQAHENPIGRVQFIEGGLISSAQGEGIKVWDLKDSKCIASINQNWDGFYSTYDEKRKLFAISTNQFAINIYAFDPCAESFDDLVPHKTLIAHTNVLHGMDFNQRQDMLASVGSDRLLAFWNINDESLMASFSLPIAPYSVTFNHAGTHAAVGLKGSVQLYDVSHFFLKCKNSNAHEKVIWKCAFSSDDSLLVTGSEDTKINIWSVPDLQCLKTISAGLGIIHHMEFDTDKKKLFAGLKNGKAALIDMNEIMKVLKEQQIFLKYGMAIKKARFLVKANQATFENPLVCEGDIKKVFNTFSREAQQQLLKNFYLNCSQEELAKKGRRRSKKKGSQKKAQKEWVEAKK